MAFTFRRCLDGSVPLAEHVLQSNISAVIGSLLYISSGYVTNATPGNCTTGTVVGVCDKTIDNSGGSAGDYAMPMIVNPSVVYEVLTTGTPAQSQIFTSVDLGATCLLIDEDDPKTDGAGVVKIRKLINATTLLVEASINFASPTAA